MKYRTNNLQPKHDADNITAGTHQQAPRTRSTPRPSTEIRRDARSQLNVSGGGIPYEKARSRRIRTRAALEQSGSQQSAVALGTGRHKSNATGAASLAARRIVRAPNVDDLEQELQQKSFLRRANISHGCRQLQRQHPPAKKIRMQTQPAKRKLPHRPYSRASATARNNSEPELPKAPKSSSILTSVTHPRRGRLREDTHKHNREVSSYASAESQSRSQSQAAGLAAVANPSRSRSKPQRWEDYRQRSRNQPGIKSEPEPDGASEPQRHMQLNTEQDKNIQHQHVPVKMEPNTEHGESNQQQKVPVKKEHIRISRGTQNDVLNIKPETVVIDLLSSDSEDDNECSEHESVLMLAQLLQNEAIGRGANPKEMQSYAQQLFRLGLHSKEMILDALDSDLNDGTNTDLAIGIIHRWQWMKPFHKTIFHRWVKNEQERIQNVRNRP